MQLVAADPSSPPVREEPPPLCGVYRLGERLDERAGVERFAARRAHGGQSPVVLLREAVPTAGVTPAATWPGAAWELELRERLRGPAVAPVVDQFEENGFRYLVLDSGPGVTLWNAWDDPKHGPFEQYAWLAQLAEVLDALHQVGVVLESLRPDQVVLDAFGRLLLDPTVMLLPVPLPGGAHLRPTLASAPELATGLADPRSDLYCFGAVLYALQLGRELTDLDCTPDGLPIPFADRCPDAHPFLVRLIGKTYCRDRAGRFPTGPTVDDVGGFIELHRTLRQCQRLIRRARLEVAAWSSSGMVRGGNEDALAVVHASESREDVTDDAVLTIVADGIGGGAAGEVAAIEAVRSLRRSLLPGPPFAGRVSDAAEGTDGRDELRRRVGEALREANRHVYTFARRSAELHGMATTAEVGVLDGRHLVVGHVGDSRTYLLHRGHLKQLTRDHTVISRLIQLGEVAAEDGDVHPRRGELEQAIGGRDEVVPSVYTTPIAAGDWVLVCTDGLTSRLRPADIQDILERAASAELAARRLINRANRDGADDNVTVIVIRCC
jgi:serine/threonine protein phosphatase PrpC